MLVGKEPGCQRRKQQAEVRLALSIDVPRSDVWEAAGPETAPSVCNEHARKERLLYQAMCEDIPAIAAATPAPSTALFCVSSRMIFFLLEPSCFLSSSNPAWALAM